ncbi:MAG: ABC transporter ATP-binding protein [Fimbriimonadales bacterium]
MPVLEVRGLEVAFGDARILRGVSFTVDAGETLGVVGESGCGKSMTAYAVMGMLQAPGRVAAGSILLEGRDLTQISAKEYLDVRGDQIALVMQDPFTSLNPMMKAGEQIAEALRLHQGMNKAEAWSKAVEMLDKVGVPAPESAAHKYPHQMSGGQRQRVVIGIAFACKPKVLICDEPTTALDVTLQAQILRLIRDMAKSEGTAVIIISHDIGVIGSLADRIAVFYAGRIVETGPAEAVLRHPAHPYTQALLASLPRPGVTRLESIGGQPPDLAKPIEGCAFAARCRVRFDRCDVDPSAFEVEGNHTAACWKVSPLVSSAKQESS